MDDLDDAQMVEAVKRLAREAKDPALRSAAVAIFGALARTQGRDRAMFTLGVRSVAPAMSDAEIAALWERVRPHA